MRPDEDFKLLFVLLLLLLLKEVLEVFVVEVLFSFWFVPMSVKDEEDVEVKSVFCGWSSVQSELLFWDEISSS